eukprot:scaffold1447_cov196-Alexandrium_tamarense.AAC.13
MKSSPSTQSNTKKALLVFVPLSSSATAFLVPSSVSMLQRSSILMPSPCSSLRSLPDFNSLLLTDGLSAATYVNSQSSDIEAIPGALSTLRTFFVVIAAAIFGITALVYLTAAFLVPKAAQQLEEDTKRLRPDLWDEYQAKLNEGESMVNRPDLLQELGNKMQPIIVADFERSAEQKYGKKEKDEIDVTVDNSDSGNQ